MTWKSPVLVFQSDTSMPRFSSEAFEIYTQEIMKTPAALSLGSKATPPKKESAIRQFLTSSTSPPDNSKSSKTTSTTGKRASINGNQKGKRVERSVRDWLKQMGATSARRTHQYNGKGPSDVVADELAGWHIESKGTRKPFLVASTLAAWHKQLLQDVKQSTPWAVIINIANNREPVALVPLDTWNRCVRPSAGLYDLEVHLPSINPTALFTKRHLEYDVWDMFHVEHPLRTQVPMHQELFLLVPVAETIYVVMDGLQWYAMARATQAITEGTSPA